MLNTMTSVDNMRLFTTALALQDKDLYQPIDVQSIIEGVKKENEVDEEKERVNNTECKNFVLAKKYIDIDELREDDGTADVFFDEKYDTTRYDIGDEFADSREALDDDAYRDFIFRHLMENQKVNAGLQKVIMLILKLLVVYILHILKEVLITRGFEIAV